jgi:ABC-type transport system involved in multi-copper enzyme maturation permease subunit
MGSVYLLTLRQLAGKWRLAIMAILASMPLVITVLMLRATTASSVTDFEGTVLGAMLAGAIIPLVVLAIAAAAFGNEVDDRTLANLTISPLPRWQIALPKLLATISVAGPFIGISALLTAHIAFLGEWPATIAITVSAVVGVAMYASMFVWLGLVSTQAIGIGLLYIVLWEGFFTGYVSGVRLLSIRYHAVALMHGLDPRRFAADQHVGLLEATVFAVVVIGGFLLLSLRRLRTMDVP